jgi:hypothetical protein
MQLEDKDGFYGLWIMDDDSRDILWESRTDRKPHQWRVGEVITRNGKEYTVKRVHGENQHWTVIVS